MITPITEFTSEQAKFILARLATLNEDYTTMSVDVAVLKEKVNILYTFFWVIMTTSIGAFLTNIWQLFKMHRK